MTTRRFQASTGPYDRQRYGHPYEGRVGLGFGGSLYLGNQPSSSTFACCAHLYHVGTSC